MPKKVFQCPYCSKKSTRGAGLASHIRSAHPQQPAASKEQTAPKAKPTTPSPTPVTAPALSKPRKVEVPSANGGSSSADLLVKAFAQLTERKLVIEEELSRTENLRNELETINLQVESLKTTLGVFGTSATKHSSIPAAESDGAEETQTEQTTPSADSGQEFTGSKRELVMSIVDSRASAGIMPKEIEGIFAQRKISKGRNLIYNVLSLAVQRGKMRRENGKYFSVARAATPPTKPSRRRGA